MRNRVEILRGRLTVYLAHLFCIAPQSSAFFGLGLDIAVEEDVVGLDSLTFQYLRYRFRFFEEVKSDMLSLRWQSVRDRRWPSR